MACSKSFIVVLFVAGLALSQIEVGLGLGYGVSAGGSLYTSLSEENAAGDETKVEHKYASGGNGLKIDLDAAYFIHENLGFMLATGYAFLGSITEETKSPSVTVKNKSSSSYIPINLGVKLKTSGKDGNVYAYMAPGIYLPSMSGEMTGGGGTGESTMKFDLGFGISSGVGILLNVSQALGVKVELNSTYAFAKASEYEVTAGGTTTTTKFVNDKIDSQLAADEVAGQPNISFSSINLKVAAVMAF